MFRFLILAAFAAIALNADDLYQLDGRLHPESTAYISLFGVSSPFTAATQTDSSGRFTFKKLTPGAYTIAVFILEQGEARQTIEVGPGVADDHNRISLDLAPKESDFVYSDVTRRRHSIPATQLAIPDKALRQYADAQKDLGRRDVDSAVKRLEDAVAAAPQFAGAWNELGTIAYQTRKYDRAERCFRTALEHDPDAYEPLVNLGGVLVTVNRLPEAWEYNLRAVLARPNDALANSQFGMTYFGMGEYDLAIKYLERARQIDPSHFSHPQLILAEIHLRRGEHTAAADAMDDFLKHHPDWPQAARMRATIESLRQ